MAFLEEQQEFATKWLEPKVTFADRRDERVAKFAEDILGAFWVEQQKDIETLIHQVIQNTRKDFLRSEIERVELEANEDGTHHSECPLSHINLEVSSCVCGAIHSGKQQALTSIITRYKEELKVLEGK